MDSYLGRFVAVHIVPCSFCILHDLYYIYRLRLFSDTKIDECMHVYSTHALTFAL